MASIQKSQVIKNSSLVRIKNLAEAIALGFSETMTPLEKIAEEEGVPLYYDTYGDTFDGMTIYDAPDFHIHINTSRGNKEGSTRGRFTVAHELAHYIIDHHRIGLMRGFLTPHISRNNEESHSRIEREADYFASCLLMPESRFKLFVKGRKFNFELLQATAAHFHVSITAAAIRFAAIGNHPLMIVFGRKGKIAWKWCSEDFPFQYLLYADKIPETTVMGDYFYGGKQVAGTDPVWAIDWFNVRDRDVRRQFNEHCITHNDMALSIIWEK